MVAGVDGDRIVVADDENLALNFWHYWNDWVVSIAKATHSCCCYGSHIHCDSVTVMTMRYHWILVVVAGTLVMSHGT